MRTSLRAGAAATAVLFSAACVDRYTIPTQQLQYLNGYSIHGEQNVNGATVTDRPYRLISAKGEAVDYNSTMKLVLLGDGGTPLTPPGPYELISVNEEAFDGVPIGGPPLVVPLPSVSAAQVTVPRPDQTAELISVIVAVITLGFTIAAVAGGQPVPCCALRSQNAALK